MSATLAALAGIGAGVKFGLDYFASKDAMKTQQANFEKNQAQALRNEKELIKDARFCKKAEC